MIDVPKVSISIITYNHKDFIAKALDSVLRQKTDFGYEIIVGDDFSTDGTQEILKCYQRKYPDIIQLILHPRHNPGVPGRVNNITNLYACRGEYIALLDGDDYWTDVLKLSKQVAVLDEKSDYAIVGHAARKVDVNGNDLGSHWIAGKNQRDENSYTLTDILNTGWCFAQTSTLMFRNGLIHEFPEWFWKVVSADFALQLLVTQYGKLYYLVDNMTAYVQHSNSFMSRLYWSQDFLEIKIAETRTLKKRFTVNSSKSSTFRRYKISKGINTRIAIYKFRLFKTIFRKKSYLEAFKQLLTSSLTDFSFLHFLKMARTKLMSAIK
mgnify:CR=1 FL=1